jgi:hypothetical protein
LILPALAVLTKSGLAWSLDLCGIVSSNLFTSFIVFYRSVLLERMECLVSASPFHIDALPIQMRRLKIQVSL